MRRKITGALILLLIMVFCVGCGNELRIGGNASANTSKTLKMITWDNDGTLEALNKINKQFFEETGIEVEVTSVDSTEYEDLLKEKIAANDVDIFCYTTDSKAFAQPVVEWAPSDMLTWETIIVEGNALELTPYEFVYSWATGAESCRYKDGIYGIATGMTIMNGMFYNKKLFEENGWSEPQTWDEFVSLCENIKASGMAPITVGGADTWPVQMLTNAIVDSVEEGDCAELAEDLWTGRRKYTDNKSMEIFNREYQILTYMEDDYLNVKYADAPARFASGKAAMFYGGSWNAFDIENADADFEYGYFAIPGNEKHNFTGKYDLTFGVNAKSRMNEDAIKWLEFFSKPEIYAIYVDGNGFVPTMQNVNTSNKFLALVEERIKDADRTYECYNRVPANIGNNGGFDLVNYSIAGGEYDTPEEFAKAAQEEWDRVMHN